MGICSFRGEIRPQYKGCALMGTRYLALLDSRPYTGIDYGFTFVYGNHRKIHNPSHESTLDSRPFMGIDFVSRP